MLQKGEFQVSEFFVGVQLGPNSVFDEGAEYCLDLLQEKAAANAVRLYAHLLRRAQPCAGAHGR
jgi:hypothetical protein